VKRCGATGISTTAPPPVEFVRLLTKAVTDYRTGPLADDATAVCLDWYPINNH
jgi:hypothetical protein